MQHRGAAVDLVLVADELETGCAGSQELADVLVLGPVREFRDIELLDQVVVDERLLHAANDVDDVVGASAAAGN